MDGLELGALVQRRAAEAFSEGVTQPAGLVVEECGVVGGRQPFEELLHGRGESVVDLISRSPQLRVHPVSRARFHLSSAMQLQGFDGEQSKQASEQGGGSG